MSFSKQRIAGSWWLLGLNCYKIQQNALKEGGKNKSLSLLVRTPLSWGRRVSLKGRGSQVDRILDVYSEGLRRGCFPRSGFLAKPALWGSVGTAEHLHFSPFHCIAGRIFLIIYKLLTLLEEKLFRHGQHKPQRWSSWHDCMDGPWNRVSL